MYRYKEAMYRYNKATYRTLTKLTVQVWCTCILYYHVPPMKLFTTSDGRWVENLMFKILSFS